MSEAPKCVALAPCSRIILLAHAVLGVPDRTSSAATLPFLSDAASNHVDELSSPISCSSCWFA